MTNILSHRVWTALVFSASLFLYSTAPVHASHTSHTSHTSDMLRLGIISLAPPARVHKQWQAFADYLAKRSGRPVEIVVPKGFKKIKQAVETKQVELFYVNSHIFYRLRKSGKAKPLAQMMNLDKSITSRSVLFVRRDSGINSIKDLKDQKIAFVSPMGAGGYVAPRAALYKKGLRSGVETKEVFTKNLSSSIHRVLLNDVKAGTMCGLNFKLMGSRVKTGDLKIIDTSDPYPENVLGLRADLAPRLRRQLARIIVGMDKDPEGRKILDDMKGMKVLRFVDYDKKTENITRRLLKQGRFKL